MAEDFLVARGFRLDRLERLPHGVRARYIAGCRCLPCRAANARYAGERDRARKAGEPAAVVDAAAARAHLLKLSRAGVGRRAVSDAADVAMSVVQAIRSGKKTRIRQSTERRILAVTPAARADASYVPAAPVRRMVAHLVEQEGFTRREIARRLGFTVPSLPFLYQKSPLVLARTAARVERFFRLQTEMPA